MQFLDNGTFYHGNARRGWGFQRDCESSHRLNTSLNLLSQAKILNLQVAVWLCKHTWWTDGLACVCWREEERAWGGVRCDIDDKPVCLSLVSPWLNVRSQWKGGTTNATKTSWQLDPWERKYPFHQMPLIPSAPFLSNFFF